MTWVEMEFWEFRFMKNGEIRGQDCDIDGVGVKTNGGGGDWEWWRGIVQPDELS